IRQASISESVMNKILFAELYAAEPMPRQSAIRIVPESVGKIRCDGCGKTMAHKTAFQLKRLVVFSGMSREFSAV
ncbi:MAG: hypothetical protein JWM35_218, partial [Verrucomicrobia bacterium]|nr:hypothetical protein [Verrucomicrobiota bacterium]